MTGMGTAALLLAARLLMSVEFIFFGSMKVINTGNMQAYMDARGVPGELIWLAVIVQVVGGLCVLFGFKTKLAALALAGFCLVATLIFHTNFADLGEVSDFTKDLATAGGFMLLYLLGPGALSLDARLQRRSESSVTSTDPR